MTRTKLGLVFCVIIMVAGWAIFAVAADPSPGVVRLEGQALEEARAAKAANRAQASAVAGGYSTLEEPIRLETTKARAAGTITYDSSSISGYGTSQFYSYGNRFDVALNTAGTAVLPVQLSGSVTGATVGLASISGAMTWGPLWVTLWDQLNTGAATANNVGSAGFNVTGGPFLGGILVGVPLGPWTYTGPTFLVGMLNYNTNPATPAAPAAIIDSSATVAGQGWHGFMMAWSTSTGTGYTALGPANVVVRPSGNVIVPVELMGFTIE